MYAIFAMVLITVSLVAVYRFLGLEPEGASHGAVVESLDMRLVTTPDGAVEVRRPADGGLIAVVPEAESGFLRGMMRSLGRQRQVAGVPDDAPYRVVLWDSGRLTLGDPATGEDIALRAYGADNRDQMFALMRRVADAAPAAGAAPPPTQ
nr:photosynthetic complex assembly protein PuhC [Roseospira goensis]